MAQTMKNYRSSADALITYDGQTKSLVDWCKYLDLNYHVVRMRYKRGKNIDELFLPTPTGFIKRIKPSGTPSSRFPSIYQTLDHETRLKLMRSCNGDYDSMQRVIETAIRVYVKDYWNQFL